MNEGGRRPGERYADWLQLHGCFNCLLNRLEDSLFEAFKDSFTRFVVIGFKDHKRQYL